VAQFRIYAFPALLLIGAACKETTAPSVSLVAITPRVASLHVGDSVRLTAVVKDAAGSVMPGVAVTWSSSDTVLASMSSTGLVRARAPGSVMISAIAFDHRDTLGIVVSPPAPAPYVTFTLDTIIDSDLSGGWWAGVTLLLQPDQSVHIVALDGYNERLRYHGCASVCDDPAHWLQGTADNVSPYATNGASGAALTPNGVQAVYAYFPGFGGSIRYAHCPGACNLRPNWSAASLFSGRGYDTGPGWTYTPDRYTPLAADPAGGLHLLFLAGSALHYAYCGAGYDSTASWQDVRIDSTYPWGYTGHLIAVAPGGGVHVLYGSSAGLIHASCSGSCTIAANWRSEIVAAGAFTQAQSLAFGPDGRLHLVYTGGGVPAYVTYATCVAPCTAPGAWSMALLPVLTYRAAIATDRQGRLYLATTYRTVAVSRCDVSCLDAASWQTVTLDSVPGGLNVAIAVDSAGHARVASTSLLDILHYTQMLQ
jgi:hypothetical protein